MNRIICCIFSRWFDCTNTLSDGHDHKSLEFIENPHKESPKKSYPQELIQSFRKTSLHLLVRTFIVMIWNWTSISIFCTEMIRQLLYEKLHISMEIWMYRLSVQVCIRKVQKSSSKFSCIFLEISDRFTQSCLLRTIDMDGSENSTTSVNGLMHDLSSIKTISKARGMI